MLSRSRFLDKKLLLSTFQKQFKSTCLVIAEHDSKVISNGTLSTITAAQKIGGDISVLVVGKNINDVAKNASTINNITKVLTVDDSKYSNVLAEDMSELIVQIAKSYSHVLAPSSNNGKNFIPRAAAMLDSSPLSEVMGVIDSETFKRPMYAGNAIATVKMTSAVKFLLIRTTTFEKAIVGSNSAPIEAVTTTTTTTTANNSSSFISQSQNSSERPELTSARVVISGGRGLKNGENFAMLEKLADKLGGAVGASRAAVDAGYVPNDYQVGQTGKTVAPELYIAVGISGAIQHLSGMKDSKTIVAINKDKDAPIFQVADYGLVDDLFKVVPEMNSKL